MYKRSTIQAQTLGLCISRCTADELCDRLEYQVLNYGSIYFCKLSLIQRWKNGFNVLSQRLFPMRQLPKSTFPSDNFPNGQFPKQQLLKTVLGPSNTACSASECLTIWNCRFRNCSFGKLPLGNCHLGSRPGADIIECSKKKGTWRVTSANRTGLKN